MIFYNIDQDIWFWIVDKESLINYLHPMIEPIPILKPRLIAVYNVVRMIIWLNNTWKLD